MSGAAFGKLPIYQIASNELAQVKARAKNEQGAENAGALQE